MKGYSECLKADRERLKQLHPADWPMADVQQYLEDSLWLVHAGLLYYIMENTTLPTDLAALAGTKYVPEWPENPLNAWQPIKVNKPGDSFSPGDFTLQICPMEFYSFPESPRPLSFELSVAAPTLQQADEFFDPHPMKLNTWAKVPTGSMMMLGFYSERISMTLAKQAVRLAAQETEKVQP